MSAASLYIEKNCDFLPIQDYDMFNHINFYVVVERSQQDKAAQQLPCVITHPDLCCLLYRTWETALN